MPKSTYELVKNTTLDSDAANVEFTSISGIYTDLIIVCSTRTTATGTQNGFNVQFNSDTGSNYGLVDLYGNANGTAASEKYSNTSSGDGGRVENSSSSNTNFGLNILQILNYSNTTTYKTLLSRSTCDAETYKIYYGVSTWRNTDAITAIKLSSSSGNFVSGSNFTIYGIKAE